MGIIISLLSAALDHKKLSSTPSPTSMTPLEAGVEQCPVDLGVGGAGPLRQWGRWESRAFAPKQEVALRRRMLPNKPVTCGGFWSTAQQSKERPWGCPGSYGRYRFGGAD
ncbi:hypothetical protein TNIN_324821 [Trichonephila inaurata madagascariensis]|uniref:Uncharacterized protein n=1 Tax=Trichonephila inaurata madagascariensis TaxID=2747483 RepID=A0A8X6XRG1_9ARAC|nr:hypothetical protein TNIN_324821 [Trichonephila inaurata madagascariensis]